VSRFVVTGAAGFVGSHLVEALLAAGHEVAAVDAFTDYYDAGLKRRNSAGFAVMPRDLAIDPSDDLIADCDGIFHLAGQPGVRASFSSFEHYVRNNIVATQRLFAAASETGKRVVWASSSSIYGEAEAHPTPESATPKPISPYGVSKLACEHLAHAYKAGHGLDAIGLRYFTVYGPRQRPDMAFARLVSAMVEERSFELYGDGTASRSFTYIADAVEATMLAMERGAAGAVYNVGGGSEATMRQAIEILEQVAARMLHVVRTGRQIGDVSRTSADISRIYADLGWRPLTPLRKGLSEHLAWASSLP
jgi:UDP-glucuronate 4-epimerase